MTRAARGLCLLAAVALGAAGCSGKPRPTEEPDTTNLRRICQAFLLCNDFKRRGPLDEDELKRWLKELGEPGAPEEFLVSRRDGQPFVIYYGGSIDPAAGEFVLAHERDGAGGRRYVLTLAGNVKLLTDEEFARAKPAAKRPAKGRAETAD